MGGADIEDEDEVVVVVVVVVGRCVVDEVGRVVSSTAERCDGSDRLAGPDLVVVERPRFAQEVGIVVARGGAVDDEELVDIGQSLSPRD